MFKNLLPIINEEKVGKKVVITTFFNQYVGYKIEMNLLHYFLYFKFLSRRKKIQKLIKNGEHIIDEL